MTRSAARGLGGSRFLLLVGLLQIGAALGSSTPAYAQAGSEAAAVAQSGLPGMPPVVDPTNLYSEAGPGRLSPVVANALPRVYVPNVSSGDVWVIDSATQQVVD